ncbi:hypothetical protein [Candidatus Absconditicoccus praedator]|nr:hypothetical protein [Candidatus Absconditicoccus praedator]UFX83497.1 hypothetical protein HLG78_05200 [Candidatus Absconditicoccus praedator]
MVCYQKDGISLGYCCKLRWADVGYIASKKQQKTLDKNLEIGSGNKKNFD